MGPLTAVIDSGIWCAPVNFNGFRVLSSLLQRRRSPEANETLHDVWPSPKLVHYIYIFVGSWPLTEFCQVQNYSLCVQVLRSPIRHGTPAAGVSQTLRRGTKKGIRPTVLSQRAPPIFGWAAITLCISRHSSFIYLVAHTATLKMQYMHGNVSRNYGT